MAFASLIVLPFGILLPDGAIASEPGFRIAAGISAGEASFEDRTISNWPAALWLSGVA
jgi:hypothetical protein